MLPWNVSTEAGIVDALQLLDELLLGEGPLIHPNEEQLVNACECVVWELGCEVARSDGIREDMWCIFVRFVARLDERYREGRGGSEDPEESVRELAALWDALHRDVRLAASKEERAFVLKKLLPK